MPFESQKHNSRRLPAVQSHRGCSPAAVQTMRHGCFLPLSISISKIRLEPTWPQVDVNGLQRSARGCRRHQGDGADAGHTHFTSKSPDP